MKITYPECQIEISTKEVIDLLDYFDERTKSRKHEIQEDLFVERMKNMSKNENPKEPDNHEEDPAPTFEPGGIISSGDDMPKPKPYPNLTDHEAIIPRGTSFQDLIMQGLKEAEAQGKLPEMQIPTEEDPAPATVESTKSRKNDSTKKKKASGKPKKVQVLFETGWKTFNSISQAAKAIDARLNHLSHALLNGKTCNGHQVRYYSEMDDIMAEIKERNREPYQPSKPIR